jgi:hypothetical protein
VRWEEVFAVFLVSHLVADFLLQTDWQATNKVGGLSGNDPEARRALTSHLFVYTLCFVPAILWIAVDRSAWAFALLAVISIPHLVQDDARALMAWNRHIKGTGTKPGDPLYMAIDQSFHVVALFGAALLAMV